MWKLRVDETRDEDVNSLETRSNKKNKKTRLYFKLSPKDVEISAGCATQVRKENV